MGESSGFHTGYKEYVAGMLAGVSMVVVGHPFDTVKVSLSLSNAHTEHSENTSSIWGLLRYSFVKSIYVGSLVNTILCEAICRLIKLIVSVYFFYCKKAMKEIDKKMYVVYIQVLDNWLDRLKYIIEEEC